jgi:hypothetical protein
MVGHRGSTRSLRLARDEVLHIAFRDTLADDLPDLRREFHGVLQAGGGRLMQLLAVEFLLITSVHKGLEQLGTLMGTDMAGGHLDYVAGPLGISLDGRHGPQDGVRTFSMVTALVWDRPLRSIQ